MSCFLFGRGDKIIGVKFGLAAGFLPFSTATVLQRRYCCKNCSIACLMICACAMPSAAHFSRNAAAKSFGTRTEIESYTFWLYLAFTWVEVLVFLLASLMAQPPYLSKHIAQNYKGTATNGRPQRNTHSGTDRHHQQHAQNGHPKTILFHLKNSFLYDIMNMPPPQGGGAFAPLGAYHHLIAVIRAAIAATASIISSAISNAVGFLFGFIFSPPFIDLIIPYCLQYVKYFLTFSEIFFYFIVYT